jgi:hypothetical protein
VAATQVHHLVGADELDESEAREGWHHFADLMRDVADSAADLGAADRARLAEQVQAAIHDLQAAGARVLTGAAGAILYVAVKPRGWQRDLRRLFARG